jgi:hypothetical protein
MHSTVMRDIKVLVIAAGVLLPAAPVAAASVTTAVTHGGSGCPAGLTGGTQPLDSISSGSCTKLLGSTLAEFSDFAHATLIGHAQLDANLFAAATGTTIAGPSVDAQAEFTDVLDAAFPFLVGTTIDAEWTTTGTEATAGNETDSMTSSLSIQVGGVQRALCFVNHAGICHAMFSPASSSVLSLGLTGSLQLDGAAVGGNPHNFGSVDLDFTAKVTALDLRDANTGALIRHLSLTGESGAVYPAPEVAAVPAPPAITLVAAAVLVSGLARRRR